MPWSREEEGEVANDPQPAEAHWRQWEMELHWIRECRKSFTLSRKERAEAIKTFPPLTLMSLVFQKNTCREKP